MSAVDDLKNQIRDLDNLLYSLNQNMPFKMRRNSFIAYALRAVDPELIAHLKLLLNRTDSDRNGYHNSEFTELRSYCVNKLPELRQAVDRLSETRTEEMKAPEVAIQHSDPKPIPEVPHPPHPPQPKVLELEASPIRGQTPDWRAAVCGLNLSSNVIRIMAIAYHKEPPYGDNGFTTVDILNDFKECSFPLPTRMRGAFLKARIQGYIQKLETGKYGMTWKGRGAVEAIIKASVNPNSSAMLN